MRTHSAPSVPGRIVVLFALLVAFVAAELPVVQPAHAAPADLERYIARLANRERAAVGKPRMRFNAGLRDISKGWSKKMARRDTLAHNPRRVRQVNRRVTTRWSRLGENVGYAQLTGASTRQLARRVHKALMHSPPHRANLLGDYNRIGVGIRVDSRGKLWVTQVFMKR